VTYGGAMIRDLRCRVETWGLLWTAAIRKYCWALAGIEVYGHDPL